MRLDKLLAHTGFGTRKTVKLLIKKNQVKVNGRLEKDGKLQIDPDNDEITVSGEKVSFHPFIYLMLHKPGGVISATSDHQQKTVIDLLGAEDRLLNPFPVGRLDKDTEGLLLLTNDGNLAHNLLSPKKHVTKRYLAVISGIISEDDIQSFKMGISLNDGVVCRPADLAILSLNEQDKRSTVQVSIREGRFHQVKRMFKAVGKQVLYLKRLSMGPLKLDPSLPKGHCRPLTEEELELLKDYR